MSGHGLDLLTIYSIDIDLRSSLMVYMFRAIWKPRAVCRLHAMQSADCARAVHARVCFGEITLKKTERIVMIL